MAPKKQKVANRAYLKLAAEDVLTIQAHLGGNAGMSAMDSSECRPGKKRGYKAVWPCVRKLQSGASARDCVRVKAGRCRKAAYPFDNLATKVKSALEAGGSASSLPALRPE